MESYDELNYDQKQELMSLAKEKFNIGKYKESELLLNQLSNHSNQKDPEFYQMLATIYYAKGKFNKALKTFKKALEIDPYYTDASIGLSIILNDLGKYQEGRKIFQEAQKKLEQKNSELDPYIKEKLNQKHNEIASIYLQHKKYEAALDEYLKAQKLIESTETSMNMVECYLNLNNISKAIKELKKIINNNPKYTPSHQKLGAIYYNLNKVAEAVEEWEKILKYDPYNKEAIKCIKIANESSLTEIII